MDTILLVHKAVRGKLRVYQCLLIEVFERCCRQVRLLGCALRRGLYELEVLVHDRILAVVVKAKSPAVEVGEVDREGVYDRIRCLY